jgi:hypothetical protein
MRTAGKNIGMAAVAGLAYGVYEEAEVEDIAARMLMTGQIKIGPDMRKMDAYRDIKGIIAESSIKGGFAPKEVGEAMLVAERQFGGLPLKQRLDVMKMLLPAAMQEARFKETGLKESAESLVGLAHMSGTYDPKALPDLWRKFTFASMITPVPLTQFKTALSYSMPVLKSGMGMGEDAIMFLTAMTQSAGITNTKSGTWLQAFFGKLMPDTGINLTRSKAKHNEALREMGLLDAQNHVTWKVPGADGKTDWMASILKLSQMLGGKLAGMPDEARMGILDQLFGKQGGREAALFGLKEFVGQFPALAEKMKEFTGGEELLKELERVSPVQQARDAFSDLRAVLMDLGEVVLPPLTAALKEVRGFFDATQGKNLPKDYDAHEAAKEKFGDVPPGFFRGLRNWILNGKWDETGDAVTPEKQSYVPPGGGKSQAVQVHTVLNIDGRKIGEAVTMHQVRQGAGPAEGSPYHDATWSTAPIDLALVGA